MPQIRLSIGALIFVVAAFIYLINLVAALARRQAPIPVNGAELMVLGIGLSLVLKL
jgi:hypothetical protein